MSNPSFLAMPRKEFSEVTRSIFGRTEAILSLSKLGFEFTDTSFKTC